MKHSLWILLLVGSLAQGEVYSVKRTDVESDGTVTVVRGVGETTVRLPASADFAEGNLYKVGGLEVKVEYLSRNVASPSFEFGHRNRFLQSHPLYLQEEKLLKYSGLLLYPAEESENSLKAAEDWIEDLNMFLKLRRRDPKVVALVQGFVLNYSKNPPQGYLAGDHVWDKPRQIDTWIEFYEAPMFYDLAGNPLTVNGRPLGSGPQRLSKERLSQAERLHHKVMRNLRYSFEGFRTLLEEGDFTGKSSELAEATCTRRSYLTLKLLEEGKSFWEEMKKKER